MNHDVSRIELGRRRRLVFIVRALLVCALLGALSTTPSLRVQGPDRILGIVSGIILLLLSVAYVTSLWFAARNQWLTARRVLFSAWSVYPASTMLLYREELDPIMGALFLVVSSLFVGVVEMGMMATAPWKLASRWIVAMLALWATASLYVTFFVTDQPELFIIMIGIASLLLIGTLFPAVTMVRDLASALDDSDHSRQHAEIAQQRARDALNQAEAANAAKSRFLANMSHELRTPLNAILGYAELLQEESSEAGHAGYAPDLERIHSSGSHLLGLINAILDLSKIEAGKMEIDISSVDVRALVEELVTSLRPMVLGRPLDLQIDVADEVRHLSTDLMKLRQILLNLLSNAIKYTDTGSVTLRVRPSESALWFDVIDTGPGISDERVQTVFQAFERTDAEVTRRVGGTGLGLAISQRLCQLLGGSLTVTSELGSGSTFTVALPLDAPSSEAITATPTRPRVRPAPQPPSPSKTD